LRGGNGKATDAFTKYRRRTYRIAQRGERKGQSTGKTIKAHEGEEVRVKSCRRNSITPRYKNCHAKPTVVTKVQTVQRITSLSKRVKNKCKV